MGKSYRKVYVDDDIYKTFKRIIHPMKVSQTIELYMRAAIEARGSMMEGFIEQLVENYFKAKGKKPAGL